MCENNLPTTNIEMFTNANILNRQYYIDSTVNAYVSKMGMMQHHA